MAGWALPALTVVIVLARHLLLAASTSRWLRERATKTPFVRRSVSAFMPGERLEDAMAAASAQQAQNVTAMFTRLGEHVTSRAAAEQVAAHYVDALDRIAAARLDAAISVKPTQLGLDVDAELCFTNLQRLVDRAAEHRNFVWIDMEHSTYVDRTLDLFRRTHERSPRVGVALQAYLHRTAADLESLLPLGAAIRIVKGAYLEPAAIALQRKADVDENFFTLACHALSHSAGARGLLQIATHDHRLIDRLRLFVDEQRVVASSCEYAMLYGIRRPLQRRLAESGRPLRILIAYGDHWFEWYMRRLAERPANLWFVVRNLFAT